MHTRLLFSFCLALLLGCTPEAVNTPHKAVFILLDGIPADVIEQVETPVLDEIAAAGGYTRAYVGGEKGGYSETPSISAPGYMSLLTGTWANKHNVWGNYNQDPNYAYWNLFRIAEAVQPELQTAIFSTWLDNRTILVGDGLTEAGSIHIDYAFDGFEVDTVAFPHGSDSRYILAIDEHVSKEAGRYIADQAPDLSWVYLEYTDDTGHAKGDGDEMVAAVKQADEQVGRIWAAVKQRQALGEDWMIVITTDHGRDSLTGKDHGGQSTRERTTWITTNQADLNTRFSAGEPGIVDIAPSILRHLGVAIPAAVAREMDGISFVGASSAEDLRVELAGTDLRVSWHAIDPTGSARLLLATANGVRTGTADEYETLATVEVAAEKAVVTLTPDQVQAYEQSGILKVVLEAPHTTLNRWWQAPKKSAETP